MQLVAALLATFALGQSEPAVTVTAPDRATTIEREEVTRWTRLQKRRRPALDILIRSAWIEGEAREQGIVVTARQVRARVRAARDEPQGRLTAADIKRLTRVDMLAEAIREKVMTAAAQSVSQEQIDAYVQAHPRTEPERRTFRAVLAKTERDAKRAKRALRNGVSWRTVARRYSIDDASARQGGLVPGQTRDMLPARLARAAFDDAEQGDLVGPVKTQFGYHVVKVVAIVPEQPTAPETLRAYAWEILASEAQQSALETFEADFVAKWRARTVCAPDLASHPDCGNT